MNDQYDGNYSYWSQGYDSDHVESFVFRSYGRFLDPYLPNPKANKYKLLDFGCGGGAAPRFYHYKGYEVYGLDISPANIELCSKKIPDSQANFSVVDPKPQPGAKWFNSNFNVITAYQSLYYVGLSDLDILVQNLANNLVDKGFIIVSLASTKHWYHSQSVAAEDGLRCVTIDSERLQVKDYYMFFLEDEKQLLQIFDPYFKKLHLGYYDAAYREDEGSEFHYLYFGQKR